MWVFGAGWLVLNSVGIWCWMAGVERTGCATAACQRGATGSRLVKWPRGALWTAIWKVTLRAQNRRGERKEKNKKIKQGRSDPLIGGGEYHLLEGLRAVPVRPSVRNCMKMKVYFCDKLGR